MIPINNYPEYRIYEDGTVIGARGKELKTDLNSTGYKRVTLCKDGVVKRFFVHRLVAEHFCDNPEALPSVNHKDGNRLNCHKDNLEWCTNSYNVKDGYSRGRVSVNKTPKEIAEKVYAFYRFGLNKRDISRYFQLDAGTVLRPYIVTGKQIGRAHV